ncbi:sigma-70 family RNA polymerase sigma factor [Sphingomonas sp. GlSt437]|uniref:sigma-70 family RNA polymerase sigma factor n=1 Tax=Sphingomonas sp. GlSt437 TaxID=3389970 RepID=UPI003A88F7C6
MTTSGTPLARSEAELKHLMVAGLDGDAGAQERLLRAMLPLLRGFFGRRLGREADEVEDLVQETLIALHTRRATFDRDRPFTAWAYAVARYKLVDHFRRRRAHVPVEDVAEILLAEGFEDALSARLDVDRLLEGLSPKQARAIRDTKISGLSVAEAASDAKLSEADVKVSVHRGLKALAERLKGQ